MRYTAEIIDHREGGDNPLDLCEFERDSLRPLDLKAFICTLHLYADRFRCPNLSARICRGEEEVCMIRCDTKTGKGTLSARAYISLRRPGEDFRVLRALSLGH